MTGRLPKLIAFDLDYTLWDLWVDTHITYPLRRDGDTINEVLDKYDTPLSLYQDVGKILHRLRDANVIIAACSRTSATKLARQALTFLLVAPKAGDKHETPRRAIDFFDQTEIYPGSKLAHFRKLHEKTGTPYSEMLFYDDEIRNKEVESLGVTFCLVSDGLDDKVFERGLAAWRKHHPADVDESRCD